MGGAGAKSFHSLKKKGGGLKKFYPALRGATKSFGPMIFPFCSPPLPVINDQSLRGKGTFRINASYVVRKKIYSINVSSPILSVSLKACPSKLLSSEAIVD